MLQKKPEEGYGEGDFKTFPQISYLQRAPSYETKKNKKRKGDNSKENGQRIQRGNLQKKIQIAKKYIKRCSSRLVIREMKI